MIINIKSGAIYSYLENHYIVQYVSKDFALISGILDDNKAIKFSKNCILSDNKIFNLIVSEKQYHMVTYESLRKALLEMKIALVNTKYSDIINKIKIVIPLYSIGFEKLDKENIKNIINDLFFATNLEITLLENNKGE